MRTVSYIKFVCLGAVCALTLSACGHDTPTFSFLPTGQTFKQSNSTINNKLDILWVVDNSGSMGPLQNNLVSNFNSFISDFQNKGYDFRMAVTTSDAYLSEPGFDNIPSLAKFRDGTDSTSHTGVFVILPTTPNLDNVFVTNATQGSNGSGDERAFSSMRDTLNSSLNAGFLRPDSFFAVIILSDEDDFSGAGRPEYSWTFRNGIPDHDYNASTLDTVSSYVSYLDTLTQTTGAFRRYNVSSIAVLDNNCLQQRLPQDGTSIIGQRYIQLSNATNGVLGSICDASYANALNAIQSHIAELSTQFYLDRTPDVSTIVVQVDGATIPQDATNGWTYNSSANSIMFHGTAIPAQNATIGVYFEPTTVN